MDENNRLWYKDARSLKYLFYRQIWHLIALIILIPIVWVFASPVLGKGAFLGINDNTWFWLCISLAIVHQVITWVIFRLQLGWGTLTNIFGQKDILVWGILFIPLLISRPITIFALAYSNQNTLMLPKSIATVLFILLMIPTAYTMWSVFKYFGIVRAMGGDHFRIKYRNMPLVKEGAFKYFSNSMYAFGFLLLWAIAIQFQSRAAISAALFQHAYIWVHFYCTERPDMDIIYETKLG
jgi:hypothetical protein